MSEAPAKVAFFLPQLGGGGAEMNAIRVANGLDPARYSTTLLTVRPEGPFEARVGPEVSHQSLLKGSLMGSSTLSLWASLPLLRRWIRRNRPQIMVGVMDHCAAVLLLACRLAGTDGPRVVANMQNNPEPARRKGLVPRATLSLALALYRKADRIVALSKGVAQATARGRPWLAARTEVIPNAGVDADVRTMAALPIAEALAPGERLIVAVGRLVEQKGYPVLLRAFAQVRQTTNARLWILGDGPLKGALEAQARDLQLGEAIRFLGFRPNPYAYMARADVFVLASHWEGFGNVIVEAMAAGTAVVATDCPYGPGEIVEEGVSGRLVPPGDAAALAAVLSDVLHDPGQRERLVAGGLRRAEQFSSEVVAARWQQLMAQLLSGRAEPHIADRSR